MVTGVVLLRSIRAYLLHLSDILGVVKSVSDISTVIGRQSQKEVTKREIQLVDQSGMVVNLTLWGTNVSEMSTLFTLNIGIS